MSFFGDEPPAEEPGPEPFEEPDRPDWVGPPRGWLGGVVPLELLLARNERAAIFLTHLGAYPTGFRFSIHALTRDRESDTHDPFGWPLGYRPRQRGGEPTVLRFDLEFSDGRRAIGFEEPSMGTSRTAASAYPVEEDAEAPAHEIMLTFLGGSGSDREHVQECWVCSLPPSGPLAVVCEWARLEIPETRLEINADIVREAAARAQAVWPEEG